MTNPRRGQIVTVRYGKRTRDIMPLHGRAGTVSVVGRGRPRNHGIEIDGVIHVVPAGNLFKEFV